MAKYILGNHYPSNKPEKIMNDYKKSTHKMNTKDFLEHFKKTDSYMIERTKHKENVMKKNNTALKNHLSSKSKALSKAKAK